MTKEIYVHTKNIKRALRNQQEKGKYPGRIGNRRLGNPGGQ